MAATQFAVCLHGGIEPHPFQPLSTALATLSLRKKCETSRLEILPPQVEAGQVFGEAISVVARFLPGTGNREEPAACIRQGLGFTADLQDLRELGAVEEIDLCGAVSAQHLFD